MKLKYLILIMAAVALVSCTPEKQPSSASSKTPLKIKSVGVDASKSAVEGTSFPDGASCSLGLFLNSETGGVYEGGPYRNVEFVKAAGSQKWTNSNPVVLTTSSGVLYAYHPYDASVSDMTKISVESSLDGKDYMYAVPVSKVSSSNPEVGLRMKHALALLCINLSKSSDYKGECKLSSISLSGEGIAASGTVNASDGSISATASEFTVSGIEHSFSSPLSEKLLIVPAVVSAQKQRVLIACTIDGSLRQITFESSNGLIIRQGGKFSANITVSGTGLKVSGVSVTDWNGNDLEETELVKDGIIITGADSGDFGGEIEF